MSIENLTSNKIFNGWHEQYTHESAVLSCIMRFAIYLPPQAETQQVPVLYWLSGLTCTDENFVTKAGAQQYAARYGIAIVCPDTSPRGEQVADDENSAYDFGLGAGFYVNATQAPWSSHYQMYDYVVKELPAIIKEHFPVNSNQAISGHSMGGHGALTIALKNAHDYKSVSAFAPICSPMQCPWGQKALAGYLGADQHDWFNYDATELLKVAEQHLPMLIDQGSKDDFLVNQLKPELLQQASEVAHYPLTYRLQKDYDHSYFFISSFIGEHLKFHAQHLSADKIN